MGFRLSVTGGAEQIALDEKSIRNVIFGSESAVDSRIFTKTQSRDSARLADIVATFACSWIRQL